MSEKAEKSGKAGRLKAPAYTQNRELSWLAFDRRILEEAADIEEKVKTGRLMDRMGVELFIVKNSGM